MTVKEKDWITIDESELFFLFWTIVDGELMIFFLIRYVTKIMFAS